MVINPLNWVRQLYDRFLQKRMDDLIASGLKIGKDFHMLRECIIDESYCWLISIGDSVTLAPRVHILAHDASTKMFLGYTKIGRVTIGNHVFVGANTIILPDVRIGDNVIIGAGSVVANNVPANSVAFGNPARVKCSIDQYLEKNRELLKKRPVYDEQWTIRQNVSLEKKLKMKEDLKSGIGYIQ
jgi:maltose O-acetyltransferase